MGREATEGEERMIMGNEMEGRKEGRKEEAGREMAWKGIFLIYIYMTDVKVTRASGSRGRARQGRLRYQLLFFALVT